MYSLGATLYCLLTGTPPFAGKPTEVIDAVRRGEFRPPRQLDAEHRPGTGGDLPASHGPPARRPLCLLPGDGRRPGAVDGRRAGHGLARAADTSARRWARKNRTAMAAAAVALVAGVVGLSAVLVVQTQAKADLTRSRAAVQARYDLAVEAIRTFHTGVSEDFLLKQDQFKDARDRLLTSASDFYGKLGVCWARSRTWRRDHLVAGELRGGRVDGQGRQAGGRAGGPPAGPRRPRGIDGRNPGRPGPQGRPRLAA